MFINALSISLCGCDVYEGMLDHLYSPKERVQPTKFLEVTGEVDPTLKIEINVQYITTNDSCEKTLSWLEGAYGARYRWLNIPIKLSGTRYHAIVPLDKFEPGFCEWAPHMVAFNMSKGKIPLVDPKPPVPLFWITRDGSSRLPNFEEECESFIASENFGNPGLGCREPIGKYDVSDEATEVYIDFRERSWRYTTVKRLGE